MGSMIKIENFEDRLVDINSTPVLLAKDVAELYGISTGDLNNNVKKNIALFPEDFRFQLTKQDVEDMVLSQIIPSKSHFGGHLPYAFTEEGLYMVATVLRSDTAKQVHFHIIKTFAKLRQISKNLQTIVKTDDKLKQKELIKNSNELLNEVIEADIVEEKTLDSNVKKVKDEFEINLGVIKFKRTIENKE